VNILIERGVAELEHITHSMDLVGTFSPESPRIHSLFLEDDTKKGISTSLPSLHIASFYFDYL
ncbi:hypothetical protein SK128_010407, partial [Halocaridina rubra]